MQPVPKSTFVLLYTMVFVNIVAFSLVFPLLPLYAKLYHASDFTIGLLGASFAFTQLLFAPLWGAFSDKYGRKPIIAVGLLGAAASFLLFGLAGNLATLFISRLLQGIFSGASIPAARAFVADITEPKERIREMGRIGASLASGVILGPVIGGMLAEKNLAFPFFGAALVAFLCFLFVLLFLPESLRVKNGQTIAFKQELLASFLRIRWGIKNSLMPLFLLSFLWSFAISAYQIAVPLVGVEKFHISLGGTGVLFTILGSINAFIQFFLISKIATALGERQSIVAGLALMALGFATIPFLPSQLTLLYLITAVIGVGSAISRPVITALLSKETSEGQGVTMGTSGAFESLGHLIGPLVGGFLFAFGIAIPFLFSGGVIIAMLIFILAATQFVKSPYSSQ